jgi:cytochrome c556
MSPADDPRLKEVIEKRGLELVSFVIATKIAEYAGIEVTAILTKHMSRRGIAALSTMTTEMNGIAMMLMAEKKWDVEMFTMASKEIEAALEQQIQLLH